MNKHIALLVLMAPLAACATMARGTSETLTVESEPPGAAVTTSNGLSCPATPCTFEKVKREDEFTITVTKDGYAPQTVEVTHHTSTAGGAALAGTIALPGGLLLSLIDLNFGATQDLTPNPVRVTLERDTGAAASSPR